MLELQVEAIVEWNELSNWGRELYNVAGDLGGESSVFKCGIVWKRG